MWADTLLAAERAHLLRHAAWGIASVLTGTALLVMVRIRPRASPLLLHFAVQTAGWGAIDLLLVGIARGTLVMRDLSAARALERFLWLNTGLDVGYIAVGVTIAMAGWVMGHRLGAVGAGMGIVVQGLALFALDLNFAAALAALV